MDPSSKTQKVVVRCPGCRKESTCRRELIGRSLRCKYCATIFQGREPEATPEAVVAAPAAGPTVQRTSLDCPGCGRQLRFRTQYLGQVVACKHCDCTFVARGKQPAAAGPAGSAGTSGKRPDAGPGAGAGLLAHGRPEDEHPAGDLEEELSQSRPGESLTIALRDLELRLGQVRARQRSEKRLRTQLDEARTRLASLGTRVAELEEEALRAKAVEEELGRSREARRRDEEKLAEQEVQIREARAREAALLAEFRAARDELGKHRDADEQLARLGEELRSLRTEEARWGEARLAWDEERARASAQLEEARLLAETGAGERDAWDRERGEILAQAEARIAELQAGHAAGCLSLRDEIDSIKSRSDEAIGGLRQEREAQRLEIERLGRDLERARAESASLASERDELRGRAASRDPEVRGLEERVAAIEVEKTAQAEAHRCEASALEDHLATARRGEAEAKARASELESQIGELRVAVERQETRAEEVAIAHRKALAEWEGRLEAQRLELEAALAEERRRHESEIRIRDAAIESARAEREPRVQGDPAGSTPVDVAEPVSSASAPAGEALGGGELPRESEPLRGEAEPSTHEVAGDCPPIVEAPAILDEVRVPLERPAQGEEPAPAALPVDKALDDISTGGPARISVQVTRVDAPEADGPSNPDQSDSGEQVPGADRVANPARGESRRWLPRVGFNRRLPSGPVGSPVATPQPATPAEASAETQQQAEAGGGEIDQLHATLDNLYEQGRHDEATELARRLVEMARDQSGGRGRLYAVLMNKLGTLLYRRGEHDEAGDLFVRSEAILAEAGEGRSPLFIAFLGNRAMLLRDKGDLAGARRVLDEAKILGEEILEETHPLREMIRYVRMMIGQGVPTQQLYSGVAVVTAGL